jgi:hypothetical protein
MKYCTFQIVANHAGYNVVELNASDDRSPALFHNTLEAATTMQSVMSENPKPNCLVLDEIDGAPQVNLHRVVEGTVHLRNSTLMSPFSRLKLFDK